MSAQISFIRPFNALENINPSQKPQENQFPFVNMKRKVLPPIPAFADDSFSENMRKKFKLNPINESNQSIFLAENEKEYEDLTSKIVPENLMKILKKIVYNKKKNEFELQVTKEYIPYMNQEVEKMNKRKNKKRNVPLERVQEEECKIQKEEPQIKSVSSNSIQIEAKNSGTQMTLEAKEKLKNIHKILGYRLLKDMFREKAKWEYQSRFLDEMEYKFNHLKIKVEDFRDWLDQTWLTFRYKDGHEEKRCILQSRRDFVFLIEFSERKNRLLQSLSNAPKNASPHYIEKLRKDIIYGDILRSLALLWLEKYAQYFLQEKSNRLSDGVLYLEKVPEILKLFQEYKWTLIKE